MIQSERVIAFACCVFLGACSDKGVDPSMPAVAGHRGLQERLSEGGGYKQDANGQWVPKSDKRSHYDNQGESPYFKGKVNTDQYKTGEYAKKSWWGSKGFGTKGYNADTTGSRFQTKARQDGMTARDSGKSARESGLFKTNTLDSKGARESGASPLDRPTNAEVEYRKGVYKTPSIIGWREQRSMSMEQSKGILGR